MQLTELISRARSGDLVAFDAIVRRFQNMAVGYAFSVLGDYHLAEDAAQEAFLAAYRSLPSLKAPEAFASWFRRILVTQCKRARGASQQAVSLEETSEIPTSEPGQDLLMEAEEDRTAVLNALRTLPDSEREVISLFYFGDYSQREIVTFLEIPVSTVKNRLRSGRRMIKERMSAMAKKVKPEKTSFVDDTFASEVYLINACKAGDVDAVTKLLDDQPDLLKEDGRDSFSPLHYAVREGHTEVVRVLLERGANPDPYEHMLRNHAGITTLEIARLRGFDEVVTLLETARRSDQDKVSEKDPIRELLALPPGELTDVHFDQISALVEEDPARVRAADDDGNTLLHRAAQIENAPLTLIDHLVESGADLEAKNFLGYQPIHLTIWSNSPWRGSGFRRLDVTRYFVEKGAELTIHIAAALGDRERVELLLEEDRSRANAPDTCSIRPLSYAAIYQRSNIVKLLLEAGADPNAEEETQARGQRVPAVYGIVSQRPGVGASPAGSGSRSGRVV